jgi:hypothetical protein
MEIEDADQLEPMTAEEFAAFVESGRWTFAKSMPGIPHEYVVADHYEDKTLPVRAAHFIWDEGRRGQWPARGRGKYVNQYLEHEGHSYWVIWPIINRAELPLVPQNEVKWLNPDEDSRQSKNWMPRHLAART